MNIIELCFVFFMLILVVCFALGCSGRNRDMVEPQRFIELYSGLYSYGDYWKYDGIAHDRHWLTHYSTEGGLSVPRPVQRVWVSRDALPHDFPAQPQQRLNSGEINLLGRTKGQP
jgi:hypothetical protein